MGSQEIIELVCINKALLLTRIDDEEVELIQEEFGLEFWLEDEK